jgi:hypothetical protein
MEYSTVVYTSHSTGYKEFRKVPTTLHPIDYDKGVFLGPPDISRLHLSKEMTLALNNVLVDAGYMNYTSLVGRRRDLLMLLQNTFSLSDEEARELRNKITNLYQRDYHIDEVNYD